MSLPLVAPLRATLSHRLQHLVPGACLVMAFVLVCSMDTSQLVLAVMGAVMYAVMQLPAASSARPPPKGGKGGHASKSFFPSPSAASKNACSPASKSSPRKEPITSSSSPEVRQVSWNPVTPVQLQAVGWDSEADELAARILPSARSEEIVERLSSRVRRELEKAFPEVEIMGFTCSDLMRGTAFGVAVPEVDIVVCLKPNRSHNLLVGRSPQRGPPPGELCGGKFKKMAIRACTDKLVNNAGFKFRRSAFRGHEPKVTLLAPAALGIHSDSIPIDLSVNSATPLHHAALLTECGRLDARAQALALLVKRWAKDRGVCHAAKGHLSPYAWTLMTVYFLQVGLGKEEPPALPAVDRFEAFANLAPRASKSSQASPLPSDRNSFSAAGKKSVGKLLSEFFRFYSRGFDFRREAICARSGRRGAPDVSLPLHVVLYADGATTEIAPSIEDPFDQKHNVSSNMSEYGMVRFREELARADQLCTSSEASLSKLLEPWAPPEREAEAHADGSE